MNADQRVRQIIGDLIVQNAVLAAQIEELQKKLAELEQAVLPATRVDVRHHAAGSARRRAHGRNPGAAADLHRHAR